MPRKRLYHISRTRRSETGGPRPDKRRQTRGRVRKPVRNGRFPMRAL